MDIALVAVHGTIQGGLTKDSRKGGLPARWRCVVEARNESVKPCPEVELSFSICVLSQIL